MASNSFYDHANYQLLSRLMVQIEPFPEVKMQVFEF